MVEKRRTEIAWVEDGRILVRGYRLEELIGRLSFADAIYLVLRGELPDEARSRLFEAILVSVVDHGPSPPSTVAAVTVASTGAELNAAVAAGVLAISRYHGGAIEESMRALASCVRRQKERGASAEEVAEEFVSFCRQRGVRLAGFGHRLHRGDPRTARLFALAEELGLAGEYVAQGRALEEALARVLQRHLPINADGAIAALLCELSFPPRAANGIFMIARIAGLVAHVSEEQGQGVWLRPVVPADYEYVGPAEREMT
ncbi:MAG: citryl-CoA lyase [Pyrinomonas sp.]|uniref:citryl-CoA lyase n=1 Tax=Pyrinomonas sp. TaxID=2080306 RepID=UPI003325A995